MPSLRALRPSCEAYTIFLQALQTNSTPTIWQDRLSVSMSKDRTVLTVKYAPPQPARQATGQRQSQAPVHASEKILVVSIAREAHRTDSGASASPPTIASASSSESRPRRTPKVSNHLASLTQRLSALEHHPLHSSESSNLPSSSADPANSLQAASAQSKALQAVFTQTAIIDPKARLRNPAMVPKKVERPVELWETSTGESSTAPRRLRDFDALLQECFSSRT